MKRVVDALIQRPSIFLVMPLKKNFHENIITFQYDDDWYEEVKNFIGQNTMMVPKFERFTLNNDILLRCKKRIYIPPNEELMSFDPKRGS